MSVEDGGGGTGPISDDVARAALDLLVRSGSPAILPVRGCSMWPTLRPGEQVEVRPPDGRLSTGDIAVVRVGGRTVAHRVVEIREDADGVAFRMKGDSNLTFDRGWVGRTQIAGIVEGVLRSGSPVPRPFLRGPSARRLATVSRWIGALCAPLLSPAAARRKS